MRGGIDVDLRHRRLLDRWDRFRGTFTLSPLVARVRDPAIGNASYCAREERCAEDGGSLNVHS